MSRARRWLIILGTCLAAFAGLCGLLIYIGSMDEPPPDTSDLAVTWPDVPPEENAFSYLVEANRLLKYPEEPECDYLDWPQELADKTLADNAAVFPQIDKALACHTFQAPPAGDFLQPLPYVFDWLQVFRLLAMRSSDHFRNGRHEAAFDDAVRMVRLASQIESAKGGPVANLVGMTGRNMAMERVRLFLPKATVEPARLRQLAAEIGAHRPRAEDLAEALRVEYQAQANTIDGLKAGRYDIKSLNGWIGNGPPPRCSPPNGFDLKPKATKRMCAEAIRAQIEMLSLPWVQAEQKRLQFVDNYTRQATRLIISVPFVGRPPTDNRVGKVFYCLMARNPGIVAKDLAKADNDFGLTQLLVTMKAYKVEKGELPERVEDLVPAYLPALPVDVFDGKPLRYSRTKRIVYSIGEDMQDSGGMSKEEMRTWGKEHEDSCPPDINPDSLPPLWELPDPSLPIEF